MSPDDVTRVREALGEEDGDGPDDDDEPLDDPDVMDDEDGEHEEEITRLQDEIERCRASQDALERYVEALGDAQ